MQFVTFKPETLFRIDLTLAELISDNSLSCTEDINLGMQQEANTPITTDRQLNEAIRISNSILVLVSLLFGQSQGVVMQNQSKREILSTLN